MKFLKSKTAACLTDLVCADLMGTSLCVLLLPLFGFDLGFGACLLLVTVNLALIFLFTRKWWLFPAFIIAAVGITLIITTIFDVNQELWRYIGGFLRWCALSYPKTLPYSTNGSIFIVQMVYALPTAVISYLYFRRVFFFPVLPPAALALLILTYFLRSEAFFPVLAMLLAAILLSMAKRTGKHINQKLPETDRISGTLLVITAIALVPVILLLAFSVSPEKDGDWQFKGLVNLVEDFREYIGLGNGNGPIQGTFDISISGFSPLEGRLGGNVLPDNSRVMTVTTDKPFLLKGAVFDTYDGKRWYDTGVLRSFRFTGFLWQGQRRDVFGLDKPSGGGSANELYSKLTTADDLEISYYKRGRTLFQAGQVESLESTFTDVSEIFFNSQSEIFTSKDQSSLYYKLHTEVFDRSLPGFNDNMKTLEAITESVTDNDWESIKSEYLQLPDTLPSGVYELAKEITQGYDTPYEKAQAIERWLGENCTYTLSPGSPPEGGDFVDDFLKTRKGYCVYFASAMTVLARVSGLPARYVIGYALERNPATSANDSYVATNATAHAWAEVYFKGIGWITFDAAGWNFGETAVIDQGENNGYGSMKPQATPQHDKESDLDLQSHSGGMSTEVKVTLISLASLAGALGIFAAIRFLILLTSISGYYRRLCRKYKTNGERAGACYTKLVRQVAFLGIRQKAGDTITSFAKRADEILGSAEMTEVCGCVIRLRFGLKEPEDSEIKKMCGFSASLEKRLRVKLGVSGYLWHRILLGR